MKCLITPYKNRACADSHVPYASRPINEDVIFPKPLSYRYVYKPRLYFCRNVEKFGFPGYE